MAAKLKTDICLMHMQGSPRTMQNNPTYEDVVKDTKVFFKERINAWKELRS
jgi:dihydropteroate synthase